MFGGETPRGRHGRSWGGWRWTTAVMAVAFLVTACFGSRLAHGPATGAVPVHPWLGLVVVAALLVHLGAHGRWLRRLPILLRRGVGRARTNGWLTVVLTALVVAVAISGVGMGGLLGEEIARDTAWRGLHHATGKLLVVVGVWHALRHRGRLAMRIGRRAT